MSLEDFASEDKNAVAVHEIGHALVNCALKLPFEGIKVWPNSEKQWEGKCLRSEPSIRHFVHDDASQIAGPLFQLCLRRDSLGDSLQFFTPSLFSRLDELLKPDSKILSRCGWGGDLLSQDLLSHAQTLKQFELAPSSIPRPRPWLFQLEHVVNEFFSKTDCKMFGKAMSDRLEEENYITGTDFIRCFRMTVPLETATPLVSFCEQYLE